MASDLAFHFAVIVLSVLQLGAEELAPLLSAAHSAIDQLGALLAQIPTFVWGWATGVLINLHSSSIEKRWPVVLHPIQALRAARRRDALRRTPTPPAIRRNTPPDHRFHG
ncbi:hypothetical protein [Actinoplanes sp. M2I2]|uniref:hypothetical protein n=1 Tax=Actinoplanes sp. M2I2 TaxID=1734444 RepID=UPI002020D157|nr:hypothetical protein [Actinoplanes sp. M2I2]